MPFSIAGHWPISTKDVLSWIFDDPKYDVEKPIFVSADDTSVAFNHSTSKALIRKLIAGFQAHGMESGDCVCIHSFNSIYYPLLVLAIIGAGGVFAGTNPSYTSHELLHTMKTARVKFVLAEPELLQSVERAIAEKQGETQLFILDTQANQTVPQGYASWRTLTLRGEAEWVRFNDIERSKQTNAALFFSSGTTGLPKAVQISHYNLIAQHTLVYDPHPRPYEVSSVFCIPLFHIGIGPLVHTSQLKDGRTAYIMRRFELEPYLRLCAKHRVTEFLVVPPIVNAIVQSGLSDPSSSQYKPEFSLKSVRHGLIGGAAPMPAMQAALEKLFAPEATLGQLWGMTEFTCILTHTPPRTKFVVDHVGSVGWPIPETEIKIVDEEGRDISGEPAARGELCVRGPTVTKGYFENAAANEETFDEDGFLKSGDIAYRDPTTRLFYIVDRKKELIKVRGFQVAPPEIEAVLMLHPGVVDAAVIGIKQSHSNDERPRAYLVKSKQPAGEKLTEEDVHAWVGQRLARYKALEGGIVFVETIPRVPSGKILKNILRARAAEELRTGTAKL